ncbi:MAG: hypothetical protein ABI446_05120 [Gemmatimonadaceae bacterium]
MKQLIRSILIIAGAAALSAARSSAAPDSLTFVIGNGPFAGTYHQDQPLCFQTKQPKMLAATFKNFDAKGPKALAEGGIKLDNPDAPGAKTGDLIAGFGGDGKAAVVEYNVFSVPITITRSGKGATLVGEGKSKEGVAVRISATCSSIEQL